MTFLLRFLGALLGAGLAASTLLFDLIPAQAQVVLPPLVGPNGIACAYNTVLPTLTNLNAGWVQCDSAGRLLIDTAGSGSTVTIAGATPATPTVSTTGAVTSLVLKASPTSSPGGVSYFHAENATTTNGYCILYNGTTAPSTGALTAANVLAFQLLPASGWCDVDRSALPIAASTGAVVLLSSATTPFTYTTGVITGSIYGVAQ